MKEIFFDIKGYEGYYEETQSSIIRNKRTGKVLKPSKSGKYDIVQLFKEGIGKWEYVHVLTARTFIPNPNNLPQVNHKDENPQNNCVENLEWCTAKYNTNYGTGNTRRSVKQLNDPIKSIEVAQFTIKGRLLHTHPSASEAERRTGVDDSDIGRCCKLKKKYAGTKEEHFYWSYIHKSTIQLDDAPCEFVATYCIIPT